MTEESHKSGTMGVKDSLETNFLEYLEGYKKLIVKVARIYCRDPEERKDLIQDIVIQLWRAFPNYDATYAVTTWTYRIALNVAISFLRKATTRNNSWHSLQEHFEWLQIQETTADEHLDQLYRFIDRLKPIDKAIIIQYLDGCKNKEIADVMGMSVTNISTRKQRITEELKSYFNKLNQ